MRTWLLAVMGGVLIGPGWARGACGGPPSSLLDPGLHRQWRIEPDCAHPERPPRLIEVPWSPPAGRSRAETAATQPTIRRPQERAMAPLVRAGMRVTVWRSGEEAEVRMAGTALEAGGRGASILVRAGLGNATLRGIVRGPGSVELVSRGGWQ